jgi:nucleoside-diphosphate-sugar epimerase
VRESEGDVGQDFHNPYERVKLEAEAALRAEAARSGVDVRVFRPSAVVGRPADTAGASPAALFFHFIRMVAALTPAGGHLPLGIQAAAGARFNIVPVGYVARSLLALARCPEAAGGTFHLVVADAPRQDAMLAMLADALGVRGLALVEASARPAGLPAPLERRLRLGIARYRDYLGRDVHFDDANTRPLLTRCGLAPARLAAADVRRLVALALRGRRPHRVPTALAGRPS